MVLKKRGCGRAGIDIKSFDVHLVQTSDKGPVVLELESGHNLRDATLLGT